jgi:hypothetical protein
MILLDKSVTQGLSKRASYELSRYFYINVAPIMLRETLADLTVDLTSPEKSIEQVRNVAYKAMPSDSFPNAEFRRLVAVNLIGQNVPMDFRPVRTGGIQTRMANGQSGLYYPVSAENEAMVRWQQGVFLEEDVEFAKRWRMKLSQINYRALMDGFPKELKIRTLDELRAIVDAILSNPSLQVRLVFWIIEIATPNIDYRRALWKRWILGNHRELAAFAPYAFHCLRVYLLFFLGVAKHIFGPKPSNMLDTEYLCYAPFCQIFATNDRFLRKLAPLVILPTQSLLGEDLIQDLEKLAELRIENPLVEPDENSLIQKLWKKHLGKFTPQAQPQQKMNWAVPAELLIKEFEDSFADAEKFIRPNKPFPHF